MGEHLGHFKCFTIMYFAALNVLVCASWGIYLMAGSMACTSSTFLDKAELLSQAAVTIYTPSSSLCKSLSSSTFLLTLDLAIL